MSNWQVMTTTGDVFPRLSLGVCLFSHQAVTQRPEDKQRPRDSAHGVWRVSSMQPCFLYFQWGHFLTLLQRARLLNEGQCKNNTKRLWADGTRRRLTVVLFMLEELIDTLCTSLSAGVWLLTRGRATSWSAVSSIEAALRHDCFVDIISERNESIIWLTDSRLVVNIFGHVKKETLTEPIPSIRVRSDATTRFSTSFCAPSRFGHKASSSSMKMMAGCLWIRWKRWHKHAWGGTMHWKQFHFPVYLWDASVKICRSLSSVSP